MKSIVTRRRLPQAGAILILTVLVIATGCRKEPLATFEVVQPPPPQIQSITHGAPQGARPGDTVSLTLRGDTGLEASASLPGLAAEIPLSEDSDSNGLYRGSLIVPEGRVGTFDLTGRLQAAPDRISSMDGPPLNILRPEPSSQAQRQLTAQDFNARKVLRIIHFDFDKFDLRPDALEVLEANADWLKQHTAFSLVIEGHCDERGTNEYNMVLGDKRANAARNWLVDAGVNPSRIRTISYGEERPLAPGHSESAWSRNRRAEFTLED